MLDHDILPDIADLPILQALVVPVLAVEPTLEGYVLRFANQSAGDLAGAEMVVGNKGTAIRDVMQPDLADRLERHAEQAAATGVGTAFDHCARMDDRTQRWRVALTPVDADPHRPPLIVAIASPVDPLALSKTQDQEIERLKSRNRDLMAFAGLVAHDMRGPLATVKMATQLTLKGFQDLGDGKLNTIQMCQRVADKCLNAIDEVMVQVSDSDITDRNDITFDMRRACREIAEIIDPAGRLEIHTPSGRVETDKAVFQSAVRNLLDNASRYAASRIDISVGPAPVEGLISIDVADDGPGLSDGFDLADHIDPMRTRDRSKGGYGLGAVAQLLDGMGGKIECKSSGAGTVFTIVMPGRLR